MTVYTEGRHAAEFLLSELPGTQSRENIVIAESQTIVPGAVLGKRAIVADVTAGQSFAGTGNGVLTFADPAVDANVQDGVYKVTCVTAAGNGGVFRVEDPSGNFVANATVGTAFTAQLNFTIADGGTDFVVGDTFSITVAADAADFEYAAHNPAATDGTEKAAAIALYAATTASSESAKISAIARGAEVNGNLLTWKASIAAADKANGIQALAEVGIIVR